MRHKVHGVVLAVVSLLAVAAPVLAHHSISSEFDPTKLFTVKGVLKQVEWANPHIYTYLDVKDPKTGKVETWSFEGNPPGTYKRAGVNKSDWIIGQEVTITAAAAKDGTKHLGFLKMMRYESDGHALVFRVGGE